jgi:tetratricopeptide (TPR) repeat protein
MAEQGRHEDTAIYQGLRLSRLSSGAVDAGMVADGTYRRLSPISTAASEKLSSMKTSTNDPAIILKTVLSLLEEGNYQHAICLLERSVSETIEGPELLLGLAENLFETAASNEVIKIIDLERLMSDERWRDDYRIWHQRGRCRQLNGDLDLACNYYKKALSLGGPMEITGGQLATVYLAMEEWASAELLLKPMCDIHHDRVDLLSNLAVSLLRQKRLAEALAMVDRALDNCNGNEGEVIATLHLNRGTILQELGSYGKALESFQAASSLQPKLPNLHNNLGLLNYLQKDFHKAEKYYRESLRLRPGDGLAAVNLAGLLLIKGEKTAREGWRWYERRLEGPSKLFTQPITTAPRWSGESVNGTLLLVHEQGLGDTFQFIRFAAKLKQKGNRCIFQGPPKLHGILLHSGLVDECISDGSKAPAEVIAWTPLMSMPKLIDQALSPQGTFELCNSYLYADEAKSRRWHGLLGESKKLRIALHWQGNPNHEFGVSRGRSLPLACLESLLYIDGIDWISLQKGPGSEQAIKGPFANRWHYQQQLINQTWDFEETAALLNSCDLLISSDSGLAHLAGALGTRVWLLLPWLPEWRWGLSGETTAWYQNHRLYRQEKENDWTFPVDRVAMELKQMIQSQNGSKCGWT